MLVVPVPLVLMQLILKLSLIDVVSLLSLVDLLLLLLQALLYLVHVEDVPEGLIRDSLGVLQVGRGQNVRFLQDTLEKGLVEGGRGREGGGRGRVVG